MRNLLSTLNNLEKQKIKTITYKKGSKIFLEGDKCEYLGISILGNIKISSLNNEGNEIIFNLLNKDDVFGINLIFSDDPTFRGDVICLTDVAVALINKLDLIAFLMNNEIFLREYLKIQSNFGKELNLRIKILSIKKADERLLFYLSINHGEILFKNITDLSKTLFLSRESLSRTISKLEKNNQIKRFKNKLVSLN